MYETSAIEFLKRCGNDGRIVSSNDLTALQIAEAQACGRFFVDGESHFGWAILPWTLQTEKDAIRSSGHIDDYLELKARHDRALKALSAAYQAGHRNGWEDGPSNNEVFDEINNILANEGLQ